MRVFPGLLSAAAVLSVLSCGAPTGPRAGVGSGGEARTVAGIVVDPSGIPLPGAAVTLLPRDHNPLRPHDGAHGAADTTDSSGAFRLTVGPHDPSCVLHGETADRSLAFFRDSAGGDAGTITAEATAVLTGALAPALPAGLAVFLAGTRFTAEVTGPDSIRVRGLPAGTLSVLCYDARGDSTVGGGPTYRRLLVEPGAHLRFGRPIYPRIAAAGAGDTIVVEPGAYHLNGWLDDLVFPEDRPVVVRAAAPLGARIVSGAGINIHGCTGLTFEGFEIAGPALRGDLVQVHGGSRAIVFRDCRIHHGGPGSHCFHSVNASRLLLERCVMHDPGPAVDIAGREGTVALDRTDSTTVRGCLFTGTASRFHLRAAAESRFIVIEDNIVAEHHGDQGDPAIILGGHCASSTGARFEAETVIARNNIVLTSATGAFMFQGVRDGWVVNNLVYDCAGGRGLLYAARGGSALEGNEGVHVVNNMFVNAAVPMPDRIMGHAGTLSGLSTSHNLYYNGGGAVPSAGTFDPHAESGALFADPALPTPSGADYAELVRSLTPGSAGVWADAGSDTVLSTPAPGVTTDILGTARPGGAVDIGAFEY